MTTTTTTTTMSIKREGNATCQLASQLVVNLSTLKAETNVVAKKKIAAIIHSMKVGRIMALLPFFFSRNYSYTDEEIQ